MLGKHVRVDRINFLSIFLVFIVLTISLSHFLNSFASSNVYKSLSTQGKITYSSSAARPLHVEGTSIKNDLGAVVNIRGVNRMWFESHPGGGWWMDVYYHDRGETYNEPYWKENVNAELEIMRSWGVNSIRFHQAVEHWKYDIGHHREIIKELLDIMAEKNMYMIFDFYCVTSMAPDPLPPALGGGKQDPLPYPPFQISENAELVISNEQEFIALWESVASELKDYPNIIFELWNEPNRGNYEEEQALNSWFAVVQSCIDVIRSVGAKQLIIVHWGYNCWVDLNNPPPDHNARTMDWVWSVDLQDPLNNLAYSTHIYRYHGSFHRWEGTQVHAWTREDIETAFKLMKLDKVAQSYPLIVGEIGADIYASDLSNELEAYENCLSIFDEWGIHYLGWCWASLGRFALHTGHPSYEPTDAGEIFSRYLI
ncbi:MAG: glycoside hydrolase family 5 protein [Candidatus Hodarchaeota archaeon]